MRPGSCPKREPAKAVARNAPALSFKQLMTFMLCAVAAFYMGAAEAQTNLPEGGTAEAVSDASGAPSAEGYTEGEFSAFIDGVAKAVVTEHKVVGMTVSVVRDGSVRALKGYGYADLETRTPVDPARHSFRIGSVTKTFTYTALMQLVERGDVDLDAPVNDYLTAFKVSDGANGRPVLVKDLFAHRTGFDDVIRGLFVQSPDKVLSLEEWLKQNAPISVDTPGEVTAYSNYGAALAGYLVEVVSGVLIEEYFDRNLLEPLGMNSSTLRQELGEDNPRDMSDELFADAATGYIFKNGRHEPYHFELITGAPNGSFSATAADMARYMMAHLNEGELDGERILRPETARKMRTRPYPDRATGDFAYGFRTGDFYGNATFEHDGGTWTSFTRMVMIPDLELGVFVSVNGTGGSRAAPEAATEILEAMLGSARKAPAAGLPITNPEAYTGQYLENRRRHKDLFKLTSLFSGSSTVTVTEDDTLVLSGGGQVEVYRRVGEHLFQKIGSPDIISFEVDDEGRAIRWYTAYGAFGSDRVPSDSNPFAFFMAVFLAGIAALAQFLSAWKRRSDPKTENKWRLPLSVALLATSAVFCFVIFFFLQFMNDLSLLGNDIGYVWPGPSMKVALAGILVMCGLVAVLVAGLYPAFAKAQFSIWRKAHYVIFVLIMINLVYQFGLWNFIGFQY